MTENCATAQLDRPRKPDPPGASPSRPQVAVPAAREEPPAEPEQPSRTPSATPERRRWSDPDEKLMLWGMLGFLGLGVYAAVFVAFGMWLTP